MFRERFKQTLWQGPALIIMAGLMAIGVNHLRGDEIPLVGDWSIETRFSDDSGNSLVIGLDEAARLFRQETALFLDARPRSQFVEGHVRGALNLPWQEADRYFMEMSGRLEGSETIVTYCDGESCDLSHELALFLKDMGFENVRVIVNGWTVWQQANLPTETGD